MTSTISSLRVARSPFVASTISSLRVARSPFVADAFWSSIPLLSHHTREAGRDCMFQPPSGRYSMAVFFRSVYRMNEFQLQFPLRIRQIGCNVNRSVAYRLGGRSEERRVGKE